MTTLALSARRLVQLLTILLTLAAVYQVRRVMRQKGAAAQPPMSLYLRGQHLPPVRLVLTGDRSGSPRGASVNIQDLFPQRCGVAVFFTSTCPGVRTVIPEWSGVRVLKRGGVALPVVWVAISKEDDGAASVVRQHDLARPMYVVQSNEDLGRLGVSFVPFAYVLGPGGLVVAKPEPRPEAIDSLPSVCFGDSASATRSRTAGHVGPEGVR